MAGVLLSCASFCIREIGSFTIVFTGHGSQDLQKRGEPLSSCIACSYRLADR